MKLKTMLLIGLFIIPLFSCNEKSEVNITETKTQLLVEIPISNEMPQLKNTNSIANNHFTGSCTFCLADSESFKACANILRISSEKGCVLSLSGIETYDDLKSLQLEWGYGEKNAEQFKMQIPIDLMFEELILINGRVDVNMDEIISPLIENMNLCPETKFKIDITGISEPALSAELKIPIVIESGNVTPHFTLF